MKQIPSKLIDYIHILNIQTVKHRRRIDVIIQTLVFYFKTEFSFHDIGDNDLTQIRLIANPVTHKGYKSTTCTAAALKLVFLGQAGLTNPNPL